MVDWAYVLVIILSSFLALFLLLAIVLVAMLIGVTHQIKKVANSAQTTAEHIEGTIAGFRKVVTPIMFVNFFKQAMRKNKKGE